MLANAIQTISVTCPHYCTCCFYSGESLAKRRMRTIFTEAQCMTLEKTFHETHYPDQISKRQLALFLNIPEDRIMVN
ncbi:unnamed protein product [Gongylonema pulchrum]|uniref:Homeobox domain-containing protein n=1 Tax=Gongylonema pulchrum TaxID=637853 RepID=A0A183DI93_9BILA|nr:unnamed protein product [Gongylonema pulchrum]